MKRLLLRMMVVLGIIALAQMAWAEGTATVLRAHPWLTRGVEKESLIGLRFAGAYGGGLDKLVFRLTLKQCVRSDFSNFQLWIQPGPAYAFYEAKAVLLNGIMTRTADQDPEATTFTVTFENADYAAMEQVRTEGWVFTGAGDRLWLTASVKETLSPEAEILVEVVSQTCHLGGNTYRLADAETPPVHRVYPYRYRINAYLRNERIKGALPNNTSDVFDSAPAQRVANLTDLTLIDLYPVYDATTDSFSLSWDRKKVAAGTVSDTAGMARLRTLREAYHPKARLHVSLTMGANQTLDSMNTGAAFLASSLGHASGDRYRAAFVQHIVELMKAKQLDGLDIDWEYPNTTSGHAEANNNEYHKYGLLMRDLAEAFFPYGWELAMCTNQSGWHMPGGEMLAAADFINAMAYGPWATWLGNSVMNQGINVCTERNVPKRRIVVGQAMYSNGAQQPGWNACASRLATLGYPAAWDCDAFKEAWTHNGKSGNYYYFLGPSTYRAKCNRVRLEGYGGVMSWGYYSDVAWSHPLSLGKHQAQAIWPESGVTAVPPQAADGFYELDSEADWEWLRKNPTVNARLMADITFTHDPLPIGNFSGVLEGNGHTLHLPADTWICVFGNAALIDSLSGTVRNLKVDLAGRVITRADRAGDSGPETQQLAGEATAAVLVADLTSGGMLESVSVTLREGSEVQGGNRAAAVVGASWSAAGATAIVKQVRADIAGKVHVSTETAIGTLWDAPQCAAGGLTAWFGGPADTGLLLEDCTVTLRPGAVVAATTGSQSSAAAGIGHLNNYNAKINGLNIVYCTGAAVSGKQTTVATPMPWIASYSQTSENYPGISGKIEAAADTFPWETWWLKTYAPLRAPGYVLRLH